MKQQDDVVHVAVGNALNIDTSFLGAADHLMHAIKAKFSTAVACVLLHRNTLAQDLGAARPKNFEKWLLLMISTTMPMNAKKK